MAFTKSVPRPDLVDRARDLYEPIRKHADWHEEHRQLHPDVLAALGAADLLTLRVPARYGGCDPELRDIVDAITELARADGSVGWSCVSFTLAAWMAALFPDETQDRIWADPSVQLCGSVELNGMAEPTEGGYVLNGAWHFQTGSVPATWVVHSTLVKNPDGSAEPAFVVVPKADLVVKDDWHTSGLRGTGSRSTSATDVFVPEGWLVRLMPLIMEGKLESKLNAESEVWQVPFMQMAVAVASAPALGMARAALDDYLDIVRKRSITYTYYPRQSEAPVTHLELGEALQLVREAELLLSSMVERLEGKIGQPWSNEEKALARMEAGAVFSRSRQAIDLLADAAGASSIFSHVPLQRIQRDITALHHHGIMYPPTNLETLGRIKLGLEPNTDFL